MSKNANANGQHPFAITIYGATLAELRANAEALVKEMSASANSPEAEEDETPKTASKAKAAAAGVAKVNASKKKPEPEPEEEDEGDDEGDDEGEAITREDVKVLLLEIREAFPDEEDVTSKITSKFGGPMLKNVPDDKIAACYAAAQKKLSTAKKSKK